MDSLEALEKIIADYKELCDDARNNDIEYQLGNLTSPYHTIKKDLKVLEILKKHSSRLDDEDWNSNIFNGIDYEDLDEEEAKIIKEWLER